MCFLFLYSWCILLPPNLSLPSHGAVGGKEQGLLGSCLKVASLDAISLLTFEFDLNIAVASPAVINTSLTNPGASGQLSTSIPSTLRPFDVVSINLSGVPEQKQEDKEEKNLARQNPTAPEAALFNNTSVAHLHGGVRGVVGHFITLCGQQRSIPCSVGSSQEPHREDLGFPHLSC